MAEQHRVAGPDGDAIDGQAADLSEDGGGEVAASAAGAGDDEHEVGAACGFPDGGREDVGVVGLHVGDDRHGAGLRRARGEQEGVGVGELARSEYRTDGPDLVPGRDDRDDRLPRHRQRHVPRRRRGTDVGRPQSTARGDEQLPRLEVLADGAHVQAPGHRARH